MVVDSGFFGGKHASLDDVVDTVCGAIKPIPNSIHIVGLLVERGVVSLAGVSVVRGVMVAHVYWV